MGVSQFHLPEDPSIEELVVGQRNMMTGWFKEHWKRDDWPDMVKQEIVNEGLI